MRHSGASPPRTMHTRLRNMTLTLRAWVSYRGVSKGVTKPDLCFRRQSRHIEGHATGGDPGVRKLVGSEGTHFLCIQSPRDLMSPLPVSVRTLGCSDRLHVRSRGLQKENGWLQEWRRGLGALGTEGGRARVSMHQGLSSILSNHTAVSTSFCEVDSTSPTVPKACPLRTESSPSCFQPHNPKGNRKLPPVAPGENSREGAKRLMGGILSNSYTARKSPFIKTNLHHRVGSAPRSRPRIRPQTEHQQVGKGQILSNATCRKLPPGTHKPELPQPLGA